MIPSGGAKAAPKLLSAGVSTEAKRRIFQVPVLPISSNAELGGYYASPSPLVMPPSSASLESTGAYPTFISAADANERPMKSQQQQQDGNLTPRGKHKYSPVKRCELYKIAAWMALILAFTAVVLTAILYFNVRNDASLIVTKSQEFDELAKLMKEQQQREIEPPPPPVPISTDKVYSLKFTLNGEVGQFARWPSEGSIEHLEFNAMKSMRVCCHVMNQYFVCDSGEGVTDNLGLECIINHSNTGAAGSADTHILVYVKSDHMKGSECTLTWHTSQEEH